MKRKVRWKDETQGEVKFNTFRQMKAGEFTEKCDGLFVPFLILEDKAK